MRWDSELTWPRSKTSSRQPKLAGKDSKEGSVTGSWNVGTGADLVTIGTPGDRQKLHSLCVGIGALTLGAVITINLYMLVNTVPTKVYPPAGTTWTRGTDPDGIWVVNGTLEITGVLRVEVHSNQAGDNGRSVSFKYDLEDM
ncbi:hypothetical protein ES703_123023 [subsurface metagenome]